MPDTLMSERLHQQVAEDPTIRAAAAYLAADRRTNEIDEAIDQCDDKAHKLFPEIPPSVQVRLPSGDISLMTLYEAAKASSNAEDFDRRAALIAEYNAQRDEILSRFGVPALEAEKNAALEKERRLMRALRDTRATTAAGMLAKLQIAIGMEEEGMAQEVDPESTYVAPAMFSSVVADLKRLAGAAAGTNLAAVSVLALGTQASTCAAPAPDHRLVTAETEITERRTYLASQSDVDSWKEPWKSVFERIWVLEDFISETAPQSLAGCGVKLRRILDSDVGMINGHRERDVGSLAQVLDFVHRLTGKPTHPTLPTVRSA